MEDTANLTFDLLRERWIPCVRADGTSTVLGLRDMLVQAHELRELCGDTPLETAALHRLCLATLHRVFGPASTSEWSALWDADQWDAGCLDAYFDCWQDRFDLFHPERPFYQSVSMPITKVKSLNTLIPHVASGGNATLFDHHTERDGIVLTPSQAARALVALQAFAVAGGNSGQPGRNYTDGACTRGIFFLAQGETLFETLALNLLRYPDDDVMLHRADDCPTWELDDGPFTDLRRHHPRGYLDYLTWQSRMVQLFPQIVGHAVFVHEMRITQGLELDKDVLDPMKHYRVVIEKKKKILKPLRFSEACSLWRNSTSLFHLRDKAHRPLRNFQWLVALAAEGVLPASRTQRYMALGMANNSGKIYFYHHERVPLSLAYVERADLAAGLDEALGMTEVVRKQLWGAAQTLAQFYLAQNHDVEGAYKAHPKDVAALTARWSIARHYWGRLEPLFWQLIESLPKGSEQALDTWRSALRQTGWDVLDQTIRSLGLAPRSFKAAAQARGQLAAGLRKVLPCD